MGVMEGLTYNETMDRLKTLYWPTLKARWMIWPAVMVSEITINMTGPGARFSNVPIIKGPGKLLPFTVKIEVSIVLHLT